MEDRINQIAKPTDDRVEEILNTYLRSLEFSDAINFDQLSCEPLLGGFSGSSMYRFNINNHSYVLRILKPQLEYFDSVHQLMTAKLAGNIGVAPKVQFIDTNLNGYIMDFINGRTVKKEDFKAKSNLAKFASTLKSLHESKLPFPETRSPLQTFKMFLEKSDKSSVSYPSRFNEVRKLMHDIEELLQLYPVPSVPTHLDLNSLNIMHNDDYFFLVDWEYGGLSDPYFDLSRFPVFLQLDINEAKLFLTYYFGRTPSQLEWDRYIVAQPICLLFGAAFFLSNPGEDRNKEFYDEILTRKEVPKYTDLLSLYENGKLSEPTWKIGLSLMEGGLELVESENFKASFQRLKNNIQTIVLGAE